MRATSVLRTWSAFLFLVIVSTIFGSDCRADAVFLTDGSVLYGRVTKQDESLVTMKVRIPRDADAIDKMVAPKHREKTIPRVEVISIVITVDDDRLQSVSPKAPKSYRDLAEEVSLQLRDPEAHDLAVRLYLLAAYHAENSNTATSSGSTDAGRREDKLLVECFDKLIELARSDVERKRIRALAQMTAPNDRNWLIDSDRLSIDQERNEQSDQENFEPTSEQVELQRQQAQENRSLLGAVRSIRRRELDTVRATVNEPWARQAVDRFADTCDWFELREIIDSRDLRVEQLATLVELEVRLANPVQMQPAAADWSRLLSRKVDSNTESVMPVRFEDVSEFDLSKSVFREGKWVEPASFVEQARRQ